MNVPTTKQGVATIWATLCGPLSRRQTIILIPVTLLWCWLVWTNRQGMVLISPEQVWQLKERATCMCIYDRETAVLLTRTSQVERFNLRTGQRQVLGDQTAQLIQFDESAEFFAQRSGESLHAYSLPEGEHLFEVTNTSALDSPRFSPDFKFLAGIANVGQTEIRSLPENKIVSRLPYFSFRSQPFGKDNLFSVNDPVSSRSLVYRPETGELTSELWQSSIETVTNQRFRENQNYAIIRQVSIQDTLSNPPSVWDVVKTAARKKAIHFYEWVSDDFYVEYRHDQLIHKQTKKVLVTFDESYSSWMFSLDQSCLGRHSNPLNEDSQMEIYRLPPEVPSSPLVWLTMLALPGTLGFGMLVVNWWSRRKKKVM